MKIEILKQTKKPLVERIEIEVKFSDFDKTPSNKEVKEEIGKKLNKNSDLVVPQTIRQEYGKKEAECFAYIYDSEEALKKFITLTKKQKKLLEEEKAKKEAEEKAKKENSGEEKN